MINTKPFYSFLEKITFSNGFHRTINGVNVKLPARYVRYFSSNYKKENLDFLKSCCGEGATILDIGAHIGMFSIMAAKTAGEYGKIFAFEPSPGTADILQQTIRINELGKLINPVYQAMGKEVGRGAFYITGNEADGGSTLMHHQQKNKLHTVQVEVNTIDNFVMTKKLSKINFINIDVAGAEYDTLLGGMQVFKKYKPHFIVAIHPELILEKGDKLEDIYDLLEGLRYDIMCKGEYITKDQFCNNRDLLHLSMIPL